MKSDIEIAREVSLRKIKEIATGLGIPREEVQNYGRYIAKIPIHLIDEEKIRQHNLILVTAITPTKAGIGKTTVSIGLALGLNKIGKKAVVALREPSMGPCFGMKGGAAGGGYSQVLPMENINLHFTGDFHAVTSAHNMITALLDNYIYQTRNTCEGLKEIKWKRVLDVNDRSLRNIVSGLGGSANGVPTETGFDITPASEIMAILCLATDIEDLKRRIGNILLGYTNDDKPFTVNDLGGRSDHGIAERRSPAQPGANNRKHGRIRTRRPIRQHRTRLQLRSGDQDGADVWRLRHYRGWLRCRPRS